MGEDAKKRLVGAIVIVALAVIFVPMFVSDDTDVSTPDATMTIPDEPVVDDRFKAESFLTPSDSGVGGLGEETWLDSGMVLPLPGEDVSSGEQASFDQPAGQSAASASVSADAPIDASAGSTAAPIGTIGSIGSAGSTAPAEAASVPSAPPPRGDSDGMPSWVIQVASLGTSAAADDMVAKLRDDGYSAFVERATVNGRLYYRVRVGPEVDRARADKTAAKLGQKYDAPFVQRYP